MASRPSPPTAARALPAPVAPRESSLAALAPLQLCGQLVAAPIDPIVRVFGGVRCLGLRQQFPDLGAQLPFPLLHPAIAHRLVLAGIGFHLGAVQGHIVAGWNEPEIRMFGVSQREHDQRYSYADEFTTLLKRLWTENGFDFSGEFFKVPGAYSEPKPVQRPWPLIMSAGNSPAGRDFAARHADLNFALGPDLPTLAATYADIKRLARERYGHALSVFTMGYVVCRETEREAIRYRDYYVKEKGDFTAAHNLLETLIPNSQSALGDQYEAMIENFIAGYSALPLPEQVVDGMIEIARAGFDGLTLSWVDYDEGIAQYRDQLRPLLIQAGMRVE